MDHHAARRSRVLVALVATVAVALAPMAVGGQSPAVAATTEAAAASAQAAAPSKTAQSKTAQNIAAQSKAAQSKAARVEVTAPAQGSVILARSASAAAGSRVKAHVKLHGPVQSVAITLNGHPVPTRGHGTQNPMLDEAHGLRVGANEMLVSATVRGSSTPVQYVDRFVVGYPASGLLTSSGVALGAGDAPAASLTLQAPLAGVNQTTATLNGNAVALPGARRQGHGARALDLSLAQLGTLKKGKNTFDVQLVMNDGRVQSVHRTFTLDKKRAIAVAGVQGALTVGHTITLDASRSQGAKGEVAAHWTLLHRPETSTAALSATTGTISTFVPDVQGIYTVALRVGEGKSAGDDVVNVQATPADPLVPFTTGGMSNGKKGLQVGGDFYGYDTNPIQMTVLDRYTLTKNVWHSYQATVGSINQMMSDWASEGLTADELVFVTTTQPISGGALEDLDTALQKIGGSVPGNYQFNDPNCWQGYTFACTKYDSSKDNTWTLMQSDGSPLSVVGFYGMSAGQAWRATAESSPSSYLTGYLTKSVTTQNGMAGHYLIVNGQSGSDGQFSGFQSIDACVNVAGATCAVSVAGHTYPSPGADGIHVVVLKRNDLTEVLNTTVTTMGQLHAAINTSTSGNAYADQKAIHYVTAGGQSDTRIVIMQSVGDGKVTGTANAYIWQDLSQLGGTPEALQASLNGSHRYALVGAADNLPWRGTALESSTVMAVGTAPGQPTGQLDGMLRRGRTGLYLPTSGSPAGPINSGLYSILFQTAQTWPYQGDQALKYIADDIGLSGYPDVRSAYPNGGVDFGTKAALLQNVTCTDTLACGSDFDAVKKQLLQEFDWVQSVRGFIAFLHAPYAQNGSSAVFSAQAIYDDIQNAVPPPQNEEADLNWLGIVTNVVEIAAKLSPEEEAGAAALSIMGSSMDIGDIFMEAADGADGDEVVADSADKLSTELAEQVTATVEAIDRMETILLSDYGKLQSLGTKVGGGDPSWTLTSDSTITAIDAMNASTRAQSYTTLMPMTWAATDLEPSPKGSNETVTDDVTQYRCKDDEATNGWKFPKYPFDQALPQNVFQALSRVEPDGSTKNDAWVLSQKVSSGTPSVPKSPLTDKIYGPDSRGADGAFQYGPSWWRSTYNPPSGVVCYPPNGNGDSWSTPNIPLPLP